MMEEKEVFIFTEEKFKEETLDICALKQETLVIVSYSLEDRLSSLPYLVWLVRLSCLNW